MATVVRTKSVAALVGGVVAGLLVLPGCSGPGYDSGVGARRAEAETRLAAAVSAQRSATASSSWAAHVGEVSLDDTGTKVYIMTDLAPGTENARTGVTICTAYAPAVADFPDISQLVVADSTNVELARCAVERETATS